MGYISSTNKKEASVFLKSIIEKFTPEMIPYINNPPDIIISILLNPPIWIKRDPKKYLARIIYELAQMEYFCPTFEMKQDHDSSIFIDGKILTRCNNLYHIRCYYPEGYPYQAAIGLVMDRDVIDFCEQHSGHNYHNYGKEKGGVKVCVMKPDDVVGIGGWKPNSTIITIRNLTIKWLHGYEYKRVTGNWPFKERK